MKNLLRFACAFLFGAALAFGQGTGSFSNINLYGGALSVFASDGTNNTIQGATGGKLILAPLSILDLDVGTLDFGNNLTGQPNIIIENNSGTTTATVEWVPAYGTNVEFLNPASSGGFSIFSGTSGVTLDAYQGDIILSPQGIFAGLRPAQVTSYGSIMAGYSSAGYAELGTASQSWQHLYVGHLETVKIGLAAPSVSSLAGSGSSASIVGNDTAGLITVNTGGTTSAANDIAQVTVGSAYNSGNLVIELCPGNGQTGQLRGWMHAAPVSATVWKIWGDGVDALAPSTTYIWQYHVIEYN